MQLQNSTYRDYFYSENLLNTAIKTKKQKGVVNYRFGFNGKEKDNEIYGEGNFQNYGNRMYDTRRCQFISVDPLAKIYPWYSLYQFAGDKPIWALDLDGLEEYYSTSAEYLGKSTSNKYPNEIRIATSYEILRDKNNNPIPDQYIIHSYKTVTFKNDDEYKEFMASSATGNEQWGVLILDPETAEIYFQKWGEGISPFECDIKASPGDKTIEGDIILTTIHTHPPEDKELKEGRSDEQIYRDQYSTSESDGNTAKVDGPKYSVGKDYIDYYPKSGKYDKKNNNIAKKTNFIDFAKHALREFSKIREKK